MKINLIAGITLSLFVGVCTPFFGRAGSLPNAGTEGRGGAGEHMKAPGPAGANSGVGGPGPPLSSPAGGAREASGTPVAQGATASMPASHEGRMEGMAAPVHAASPPPAGRDAPADAAATPPTDPHAMHGQSGEAAPANGYSVPSGAQGGAAPFAVTGKAPVGVPITTNAQSAPPDMVEKLGAVVPEGIFFTDDTGKRVDVRSLMDIPVIVAPVFLTCPGGCNTLQSALAASLPNVTPVPGKDFRVLTVSFDETDTTALAERKKNNYLAAMNYKFPPEAYIYLTGDESSIRRFMSAIGFPYMRLGPGNFSHPLGVIVLAPGGKVVRYLYGQSFMPFDLNMALTEAHEGKVGLSIRRVISYCFAYDPAARGYVFNFMRVAGVIILFGAGVFLFVLLRGGKKQRKVM